jgi:hypothetical protein
LSESRTVTPNISSRLSRASTAETMSWASKRQTTRQENMAYCLLGIFDINLSMIYGEGSKAFFPLQEEIMKHSDDQSIFALNVPSVLRTTPSLSRVSMFLDKRCSKRYNRDGFLGGGVLATSPANFSAGQNVISCEGINSASPF